MYAERIRKWLSEVMVYELTLKEKYKCSGSDSKRRKSGKEGREDSLSKGTGRWEHTGYPKNCDN